MSLKRLTAALAAVSAAVALGVGVPGAAIAGAVFLTGHDPDFHASLGGNLTGARNINTTAISFITDSTFNPFTAGGVTKFLFVESKISPPGGHTNGVNGSSRAATRSGPHSSTTTRPISTPSSTSSARSTTQSWSPCSPAPS